MAIDHISVGDTGSISKINQAIDEANKVAGKAEQSALTSEISARTSADAGLQSQINLRATSSALASETSARQSADANLQTQIAAEVTARQQAVSGEAQARQSADQAEADARISEDAKRPVYGQTQPPIRPGEAIRFFTDDLDGEPSALAPLPDSAAVSSQFGKVAQIAGAGTVAPLAVWRIEAGHLYRVRFVVRRAVDTEDPANDAVRLGVRWLSASKDGVGTTQLANILDLTVEDGRVEYVFTLATADASDVDAVPAAGGIYFRPFVRAFGSGVTHVEVIQVVDATDAVVWSPDVELLQREIASLNAQIQTLSDRVQTLES